MNSSTGNTTASRLLLLSSLLWLAPATGVADDITVATISLNEESWDGTTLPPYPEGQPRVSVLKYSIPPGTALPRHKHNVINAGYILSGRITVVADDGETLALKAGDSIVELVGKWHHGVNDGDVPVEIVVFYAGAEGITNTVREDDD